MAMCKDCIHFVICSPYTAPNESFPEVGGCSCYKDIVSCKDCIEFIQTNSCGGVCGLDYHKVDCDSYCSDGNRK